MFKKKHTTPAVTLEEAWKDGDIATKLTFFAMGLNAIKHRQRLKGLSLLSSEIVFLIWFFLSRIHSIAGLSNLGAIKTKRATFDKARGVYVTRQLDSSVLILLFGILALFIVAGFIYPYIINLRSNKHTFLSERKHEHIPTNREGVTSLFDQKLYATLTTIPVVLTILFTVLPTVFMISITFTSYNRQHSIGFPWTGFQASGNVLGRDLANTFFPVLGWTLIWTVAATTTTFFFGVLLALLIESKGIKHKNLWGTIFVVVYAVPQFVSLLMMTQFSDYQGPLNTLLMNWDWISHPTHSVDNQTSPLVARIAVTVVNIWIGIPISVLISTTIVQNLPWDQTEAARTDGASPAQIFNHTTFPQILFVIPPALTQQFVGNINSFNVVYLLTDGASTNNSYNGADSTDLLITWLYNLTFGQKQRYDTSAVLGILIFIISVTFSLTAYRHTNAHKEG